MAHRDQRGRAITDGALHHETARNKRGRSKSLLHDVDSLRNNTRQSPNFIKSESEPKKDPVLGDRHPIGTPGLRVHTGFHDHGSRDWNADRGDDCEDPPCVFCAGQADRLYPDSHYLGPRISLIRSVIRPRAYPVCFPRPCRIEFSVHTGPLNGPKATGDQAGRSTSILARSLACRPHVVHCSELSTDRFTSF